MEQRTARRTCRFSLHLAIRLGSHSKWEEMEDPATTIEFMGIILNTVKIEIRLSESRVVELMHLIEKWSARKACRKRQLLSLIRITSSTDWYGLPDFSRADDRSFYDSSQITAWIHLSAQFQADLYWWQAFLPSWNRRCMMGTVEDQRMPDELVTTDMSGSWGVELYGRMHGSS